MFHYDNEAEFRAFVAALRGGDVLEVDAAMFDYFLNVLPPVFMGRSLEYQGVVRPYVFGSAEGCDFIAVWWVERDRDGNKRYYAQRTTYRNETRAAWLWLNPPPTERECLNAARAISDKARHFVDVGRWHYGPSCRGFEDVAGPLVSALDSANIRSAYGPVDVAMLAELVKACQDAYEGANKGRACTFPERREGWPVVDDSWRNVYESAWSNLWFAAGDAERIIKRARAHGIA